MPVSKKKVIKSLESLSEELKELMKKQYPLGYENSITRISNAKKESIFVFPLETDEATYLVKLPATRNSEGEYDIESKPKEEEFDEGNKEEDDFGSNDDFEGSDYDEEGEGGSRSKDPSYEPDFDN
ncbi:MAG: hypothetical protein JST14_15445 [Bacteroidetes bacterium]|nr:hypothetical protein [Bacteroidota bacterium]MBS1977109.1 hypothetical protein [Bacteroidota bacterium]